MSGYSEFGLNARKVMLIKGISVKELSQQLGITSSYVSEILKGTRKGKKYRSAIAKILDVTE